MSVYLSDLPGTISDPQGLQSLRVRRVSCKELVDMTDGKACRVCDVHQPIESFPIDRGMKSGRKNICKSCSAQRHRAWSKANPDYYPKWREANREHVNAQSRGYTRANPERRREILRRWQEKNRGQVNAWASARRAIIRESQTAQVTAEEWAAMLAAPCYMCGGPSTEVDHIVPLKMGGRHAIGNLAGACTPCNRRKQGYTVMQYRAREMRAQYPGKPLSVIWKSINAGNGPT